jgi:hypothetical protein
MAILYLPEHASKFSVITPAHDGYSPLTWRWYKISDAKTLGNNILHA